MANNESRRKLKMGDVVRVKPETKTCWEHWNYHFDNYVLRDENYYGKVNITDGCGKGCWVHFSEVELITPVEERDIYYASVSNHKSFYVGNAVTNNRVCDFDYENGDYTKEEAKSLAQAEADRLNARRRKDQING